MYHKILVPLDGSALAECALPHALDLAKKEGATVVLLSVVPVGSGEPYPSLAIAGLVQGDSASLAKVMNDIEAANVDHSTSYLKSVAEKAKTEGLEISTMIVAGEPASTIIDSVKKTNADLIVMSTHGRSGISKWLMGSVANKVLHIAPVPVLLVRCPAS